MPSPTLRLQDASFAFAGGRAILRGAHLHLRPGWTGLVGRNGSGKSTLLRLLSGELGSVRVHRDPDTLTVLRLEQRLEHPDDAVEALSIAWDRRALQLQSRLRLHPDQLDRWPSLSPGERRRWQVGAALWREPDALLLDEPDNHLDAEARDLLVQALRRFRGIGVIVSHDRALLDALTTQTLRLRDGRLDAVPAPVTQAMAQWDGEAQAAQDALDAVSETRRRTAQRLHAARQTHARSTHARSFRHVATHDHDARSDARKDRAAKAEQSHAQQLSRQIRRAEQALAAHETQPRPDDLGRPVVLASTTPRRRRLIAWTDRPLTAGGHAVLASIHLHLDHGDRVWIRGPNGAGKSTLLRALLADLAHPADHVLHLPQELDHDAVQATLTRLHDLPPDARGRVLQIVAALGVDPAELLQTTDPSPGEVRKLALSLGLARPNSVVALDEPDNHLDLPSRQRLERALSGYDGTLLLVTHDAALAAATTHSTWTLSPPTLEVREAGG